MKKIGIPQDKGPLYYDPEEIFCLRADDSYTSFYVAAQNAKGFEEILASYTLKTFEEDVVSKGLMRTHRSWIVNPWHVRRVTNDHDIILRIPCIIARGTPESCALLRRVLRGEVIELQPAPASAESSGL